MVQTGFKICYQENIWTITWWKNLLEHKCPNSSHYEHVQDLNYSIWKKPIRVGNKSFTCRYIQKVIQKQIAICSLQNSIHTWHMLWTVKEGNQWPWKLQSGNYHVSLRFWLISWAQMTDDKTLALGYKI